VRKLVKPTNTPNKKNTCVPVLKQQTSKQVKSQMQQTLSTEEQKTLHLQKLQYLQKQRVLCQRKRTNAREQTILVQDLKSATKAKTKNSKRQPSFE
jgi:hypothetical protein